ncbi:MAG: IclR family transcriptional regulator [Hyphomicrobiaceae bacterium]|nr:IclR family transcriptional regulator [Hyphomicrobiaceae bacterium]
MTRPAQTTARDDTVQSVERAILILEALGAQTEGSRLVDLVAATGLAKSTIHRLLATLEKRHFVQFNRMTNTWHIGRRAFSVGSSFVFDENIVAAALPFLRELRDRTQETANLGVLESAEIRTIAQLGDRGNIRAAALKGGRMPAIASGMGKAILATLDSGRLGLALPAEPMRRWTLNTIASQSALVTDLEATRTRGFAFDNEEYVKGIRCVAAPVTALAATTSIAVSVSGPCDRMSFSRLERIGELVNSAAQQMNASFAPYGKNGGAHTR